MGLIPESRRSTGVGMATHSSILAWKILWTEEPGRPQSMGPQRWTQLSKCVCTHACAHTHTHTHTHTYVSTNLVVGRQCSVLLAVTAEIPRWLCGKESTCQRRNHRCVWSLGQKDLLEEEIATHSSILAWRSPWTEETRAIVHGVEKDQTWLRDWAHTADSVWLW